MVRVNIEENEFRQKYKEKNKNNNFMGFIIERDLVDVIGFLSVGRFFDNCESKFYDFFEVIIYKKYNIRFGKM